MPFKCVFGPKRKKKKGQRAGGDGIANATSKLSYRDDCMRLRPAYCVEYGIQETIVGTG